MEAKDHWTNLLDMLLVHPAVNTDLFWDRYHLPVTRQTIFAKCFLLWSSRSCTWPLHCPSWTVIPSYRYSLKVSGEILRFLRNGWTTVFTWYEPNWALMVYGGEVYSYANSLSSKYLEATDNYPDDMSQYLSRDFLTTCEVDIIYSCYIYLN